MSRKRSHTEEGMYFADTDGRLSKGYRMAAQGDPSLLDDERDRRGRHLREIIESGQDISLEDLPDEPKAYRAWGV